MLKACPSPAVTAVSGKTAEVTAEVAAEAALSVFAASMVAVLGALNVWIWEAAVAMLASTNRLTRYLMIEKCCEEPEILECWAQGYR